jgi:Cu(I)/Ag(I) efflux system periplasmic protein CusF
MRSSATALVLSAWPTGPAVAQQTPDDHAAARGASTAAAAANGPDRAGGEVRKADADARKLTLEHGEIKPLDLPPMTMIFQVEEPASLDKVKTGDQLKSRAGKTASGCVVTALEAARP